MVTQEKIAKDLGLSFMTVYRCLSGNGSVGAKTKKRIENYIQKHNYRPNLMARSLKMKKSFIIGLLVPSFTYSYYPEIIESIQETLKAKGYKLLLCLSNENPESEREELEMLLTIPVDGILMSPVNSAKAIENCHYLKGQGIPFMLFDRYFPDAEEKYSYVATDSFEASKQLVNYLVDLGHRKIAHIGGDQNNSFARLMFEGYKAGLKENGIRYSKKLVFQGNLDEKTGSEGVRYLFGNKVDVTAIHTANDPIAIGVLNVCKEMKIKIPEELSVTGFSDIAIAKNVYAPLTTVKEPTSEIGKFAAEQLVKVIEAKENLPVVQKLLPGNFIERKSCRKV